MVIIGALALFTAGLSRSAPLLTEFCKVAHAPQRFEGRALILRARLIGGRPHGFVLYDPECAQGLEFDHSDPDGDVRLEQFLNVVARNRGLAPGLV